MGDLFQFVLTVLISCIVMGAVRIGVSILSGELKRTGEKKKAEENAANMKAYLNFMKKYYSSMPNQGTRFHTDFHASSASSWNAAEFERVMREAYARAQAAYEHESAFTSRPRSRRPADPVREKIDRLLALAERPGTLEEGAAAMFQAQRLADTHHIKLKVPDDY